MTRPPLFIDASFFLGMHDGNEFRRLKSLSYFSRNLSAQPRMNYEQIGICDAVIWTQRREVQDLYYPFMDRLHTDMAIQRSGYTYHEIDTALSDPELRSLTPERALLAAQVLHSQGSLATHDPVLLKLDCLRGRIWIAPADDDSPVSFPPELQALYDASRAFIHHDEDSTHGN
ncbi:TPA: hypothetical protein QDB24_005555 [Burkholderia vietnamiensis]|uniref:DUF6190 family protein n=1 Tax=Burkholderia vietnamiensis TaxID=60552 RepID=UPI001B9E76FB|nr:DUF6190 family protein [Burkholderia vietnamiensis]MBR7910783.1 hypothetical protein [Burkholderia vietnamiensis]HDR9277415.1 hypothetical protein [Burkholderia vietnamiensis]